jgi:hypothetical protein
MKGIKCTVSDVLPELRRFRPKTSRETRTIDRIFCRIADQLEPGYFLKINWKEMIKCYITKSKYRRNRQKINLINEISKMSNINLSGNWQKVGQARRDSRQLNKDVSEK